MCFVEELCKFGVDVGISGDGGGCELVCCWEFGW